jgi:hypothetical protein
VLGTRRHFLKEASTAFLKGFPPLPLHQEATGGASQLVPKEVALSIIEIDLLKSGCPVKRCLANKKLGFAPLPVQTSMFVEFCMQQSLSISATVPTCSHGAQLPDASCLSPVGALISRFCSGDELEM